MSVTEMPGFPWVPYIPCPETPEVRIEELELQLRNMSALLTTIHEYLQDHKSLMDRVKQMKEIKDKDDEEINRAYNTFRPDFSSPN